jgi:hypothetical protein
MATQRVMAILANSQPEHPASQDKLRRNPAADSHFHLLKEVTSPESRKRLARHPWEKSHRLVMSWQNRWNLDRASHAAPPSTFVTSAAPHNLSNPRHADFVQN